MKPEDLNLADGKVEFWDLDHFAAERSLSEQIDLLKEDLALVAFSPELLVDVGWYPSAERPDVGRLTVRLVHGENWASPVHSTSTSEASELPTLIEGACTSARNIRVEIEAARHIQPPSGWVDVSLAWANTRSPRRLPPWHSTRVAA